MTITPIYRADIKGKVKELMADCQAQMAGEIANSDYFIFLPEDTAAYAEYGVYLTGAELKRCFSSAIRRGVTAGLTIREVA